MESVNFILSGLGGQGILFMTKVLAQTTLRKRSNILGAETHGMAQRGGSVVSHLRLGDVESSLVRSGTAHFLIALEESEAYRNIHFLARDGKMYVNTATNPFPRYEVKGYLDMMGIECRNIAAGKIAMEMGAPMSTNLTLLGFFSAFKVGPLSYEELRETIDKVSPDRFRPLNLKAFDVGYQRGAKR